MKRNMCLNERHEYILKKARELSQDLDTEISVTIYDPKDGKYRTCKVAKGMVSNPPWMVSDSFTDFQIQF
jgi:SRF-type transcription factor (DNA-binding and dimerisation domain)